MTVKQSLNVFVGALFLFSECSKKDLEAETDLDPVCTHESLELEPGTILTNEVGQVVEFVYENVGTRVRIKYRESNTHLDPCNLPEGIPIGSKVRYSGIWYDITNADNINLDYFPLGLTKIEVIE